MVAVDAPTLEDAAAAACRAGLRAGLREADARDLAQEALVRALTSAQPPGGVPLAAWVYGIARNLGRDHAKSARSRELLVDAVPDAAPVDAKDGDLATILAVRRAVYELPGPLREVVTLHELEELSLRETAETLAIPFDTAKDRLRRAREQLRERLADADYATERSHTRRCAATAGAAIVVTALAALGEREAAAGSTAAAAGRLVAPKWLAAVVASALAVGGFAVGRFTVPSASERAPIPIAEPVREVAPATVPAPAPAPAPAAAVAPVPKLAPPARAPKPARSAQEDPARAADRLLVDRARTALQRGLPEEALVSLMAHARQYPSGAFAEERDVLIIEAYIGASNAELARRRIERYRADYPAGALRSRVEELAQQLTP